MLKTLSFGPPLNTTAPPFALLDQTQRKRTISDVVGKRGVLLGFIGDIWEPASVRRVLWLQRNTLYFTREGVNLALVVVDQPQKLYTYYVSCAVRLEFPMLADTNRKVHKDFNMRYSGLVFVDSSSVIRDKWLVPDDRVWPKVHEIVESIQTLAVQ